MEQNIKDKFAQYPPLVQARLTKLRRFILDAATHVEAGDVTESLKWGEPSYAVRNGSPVRFDWKSKTPEKYYLFFNCNTKLVDTFRELYGDEIETQGNRALVFYFSDPTPKAIIQRCVKLAFTYHKVKHLSLLGE